MDHIQRVIFCQGVGAREARCSKVKVVSGNRGVGLTGVGKTPTSGPVTLCLPGQLTRRIHGKSSVPSAKFQACADSYIHGYTQVHTNAQTRVISFLTVQDLILPSV